MAELSDTFEVYLVHPTQTAHGAEIRDITQNPETMKWVANGKVWGDQKLERFFKYCVEEEAQSPDKLTNHYHAVIVDNTCVGLVGIYPMIYDKSIRGQPTLTIFLSPHITSKGVGTRAIKASLENFWRFHPKTTVVIDVHINNLPMIRVAKKIKLYYTGIPRLHYYRFKAISPRR